ncbi:MAG: hypothetical protein GC159_24090 [Phycisphaera sp.]|nr:hypothetical protein [Phycisphaera sp.]
MKTRMTKLIAAIVFVAAIAAIPACETTQPPGAGVTPEQVALVEQQLQEGRAALAALPPDEPARLAAEKKIAELEQLVGAYKDHRLKQDSDGSADPEASIAAGVQTLAPFLPPPWNAVLLIIGGLVPGVAGWVREALRRKQTQRAGQDLARAIKAAAVANGGVLDFTDLTVRQSLKSAMPDSARAIVKDAGASVPLPFVIDAPTAGSVSPHAGGSTSVAA